MKISSLQLRRPVARTADSWASRVLGRIRLPDLRLVRRGIGVLAAWARSPGTSIARACETRAQAKAAYNFIANPRVTVQALQDAVYGDGGEQCAQHRRIFVAQDTTSLEYGHREDIEGLGPVTTSGAQGLLIHTSLAVSEHGVPLAILDQQIWTRLERTTRTRSSRPIEEKESAKWLRGMRDAAARLSPNTHPIFIFDREGDVHEAFAQAQELGIGLIVRAAWNRRIQEPERHLFEAVRAAPVAKTYAFTVPRRSGHHPSRETTMELRYTTVTLNPRKDQHPSRNPLILNVVLVTECTPLDGERPLEWCLVTTEPVSGARAALAVARAYSHRWRVEELHLVIKSGCRIEAHQFDSGERIEKVVVLLSAVALLILTLTYLARVEPDSPAARVLDPRSEEVLTAWANATQARRFGSPLTIGQAVALRAMALSVFALSGEDGTTSRPCATSPTSSPIDNCG